MNALAFFSEEIRSVNNLRISLFIVSPFQNFRRSDYGYITDLLHVVNGVLRHTHIIDEIGSSFGVLGINGDYPTIEPNV